MYIYIYIYICIETYTLFPAIFTSCGHLMAMGDKEALDELRDLFTYRDSTGGLRKIPYINDDQAVAERQPEGKRAKPRGLRVFEMTCQGLFCVSELTCLICCFVGPHPWWKLKPVQQGYLPRNPGLSRCSTGASTMGIRSRYVMRF